jgi:cob(I)alamin adenosyltransferase
MRACVIQFIKRKNENLGEVKAARALGIEWHQMGDGFTWKSKDIEATRALARQAWAMAQEKIGSGDYDLVILDEFTYALKYDWIDVKETVAWFAQHKPPALHLVITGRDAPQALLDEADLVSEIQEVKHPYAEGVRAQRGIEY